MSRRTSCPTAVLASRARTASLFDLLQRDGWLEDPLASTLRGMAGFRNVLVHGYDEVDLAVVRDVLANHLGDLEAFVGAVRRRLGPDR